MFTHLTSITLLLVLKYRVHCRTTFYRTEFQSLQINTSFLCQEVSLPHKSGLLGVKWWRVRLSNLLHMLLRK